MIFLSSIRKKIPTQLNPILVKELRQSVRSRFVASVYLLFMAIELFGIGLIMANVTNSNGNINYHAGRDAFHFLFIALSTACVLFIPAYAATRLAVERWDNNLDLMYITTIKPRQVILGKLLSAMTIALLLFSAAAPFMAFSYLMRGIDLPSIFIAIGFVFIVVTLLTQGMIFLACLPTSRAFKIILGLVSLGGLFWSLIIINITGYGIIYEGFGSKFTDPDFLLAATTTVVSIFLATGLLQRIAVALISPPSANRMLPVRRYATLVWAVGGLGNYAIAFYNSEPSMMLVWSTVSIFVLFAAIIFGLSEPPEISSRVRAEIPRNRFLATLAFLFYSGPAGALLWAMSLMSITLAITFPLMNSIGYTYDSDRTEWFIALISLSFYAVSYGLSARLIWQNNFAKRLKSSAIGVIAVGLIAVGAILPLIATLLINGAASWEPAWNIGNIFTVACEDSVFTHVIFAFILAIVMVLLNLEWILQQIRQFKPLEVNNPPPPAEVTNPETP